MATQFLHQRAAPDPYDMSRAEVWRDRLWDEPFRDLRATAPVRRIESSAYGAYWSVSGYQPIVDAEALPDIFSSSWEHGGITLADRVDNDVSLPMFIAMDRPKHTEQRRTVAPAFSPSEIARMAADIRARTGEVLDSLPVGETFDWVDRVSIELTTGMLAILFDFPWADRRKLTYWSDWAGDIEAFMNPATRDKRFEVMFECGDYFRALWTAKLGQPQTPDLISMMIHSRAMSHMDHAEFLGNIILLIVGGNDTTRNSMTGAVVGLDKFPDQRARIEADPALIPGAVSEILRWQTPVAHMRRTAVADAELGGVKIAKGDKLALWYVSGNRDESVFENPDSLIVDRANARRHLAFGHGIHRCIGARLAELQIATLLDEMGKRRLRAEVAGEPVRVAGCFINGYRSLPVQISRY